MLAHWQTKIGDYGFDPLGLGTDETFMPFREAEIKHGRLAMLAAVAWPLQEIFHPVLVDAARSSNFLAPFFVRDVLAESAGKSPSLLNGGLEQIEVLPSLSLAVFAASVLELRDVRARAEAGLAFNVRRAAGREPTRGDAHLLRVSHRALLPAMARWAAGVQQGRPHARRHRL